MQIIVYDNISSYSKMNGPNHDETSAMPIIKTQLTANKGFWFFTNMKKPIVTNLDLNKPYVHFYPGVLSTNKMQVEKPLIDVTKKMVKYNPKTKCLEVKTSIWPWRKPIWQKKVTFYGPVLPSKKISAIGAWYYDLPFGRINVILDYFPQRKGFEFNMETKLTDEELKAQLKVMKSEIQKLEEQLNVNLARSGSLK